MTRQEGLALYNKEGKLMAALRAKDTGSGLVLTDGIMQREIAIIVEEELLMLAFLDARGKTRGTFTLEKDGMRLTYFDLNGKRRCILCRLQELGAGLVLLGPDEKPIRSFVSP